MNRQSAIERTVVGLGYELVGVEKSVGGLLRVFIDHPSASAEAAEKFITVEDCELVTRQLQHVLEVEAVGYERLEVSSPGLDRPLTKAADYVRFTGQQVEVTFKLPFQGRKKYRGELQPLGDGWRLLLAETAARPAAAKKPARPAVAAVPAVQALDFSLEEVREARLVPVVDFKGRRFAEPLAAPLNGTAAAATGLGDVDGGRIQ